MIIYIISFVLELFKYYFGCIVFLKLKIRKKWLIVIAIVSYTAIIGYTGLNKNQMYMIMFLGVFLLLFITVEEKGLAKTLHIIMLICVITSLDELAGIIVEKFYLHRLKIFEENDIKFFLSSLITLCLLIGFNKFLKITKIKKLRFVRASIYLWVVIMAVNMLLTVSGLFYIKSGLKDKELLFFITLICIISYISICVIVVFTIYIKKSNEDLEEYAKIENELKIKQKIYYESLLKKEEETRAFRHDIMNHLVCLQELAVMGEREDVQNYIVAIKEQAVEIQNRSYYTGNEILDILINYYASLNKNNIDICVSGMCVKPIEINNVDMCIIFSNLLQNAMEALETDRGTNKYLNITIQQGEHFVGIQIANTTTDIENIEQIIRFETLKIDKKNHGFGLKNVKKAIEKNGGKIELKKEKGEFIAEVILKL